CSLANFRRPCTCASLSRGTLRVLQYFKPLRRSVLPMVFLVTVVPAALRSFTSSPCVVLGYFCSFRMITDTAQGNILHGAPDLERLTVVWCCLHLRIIAPIVVRFSPSCLPMFFLTHSSLVQVYNLISDVLGQLCGLAHGGEVEGVKYDSLDRFLLYTSPVEIRCTFLGLMRTNLCASWAHNWSLGARILAVCLEVQILIFCIKYK